MNIDFSKALLSLDGDPLKVENDRILTLRMVSANALLQPQQEDSTVTGLAYRLYELAHTVHSGGNEIDINAADIDLIKQRIERVYPPLVVGQAWNLLEGKAVKPGSTPI